VGKVAQYRANKPPFAWFLTNMELCNCDRILYP
jgi:hypothetical protein